MLLSVDADCLLAIANAAGDSPYERALMLSKMRTVVPTLHGVAKTPEEQAAKMITPVVQKMLYYSEHGAFLGSGDYLQRGWTKKLSYGNTEFWENGRCNMSDLSKAAGRMVGNEYKLLKKKLGGPCGNLNMEELWKGALIIVKEFGGEEGRLRRQELEANREEERQAKAAFNAIKKTHEFTVKSLLTRRNNRMDMAAKLRDDAAKLCDDASKAEKEADEMLARIEEKETMFADKEREEMSRPKWRAPRASKAKRARLA